MGTRRESVELSLSDDGFSTKMAKDAASVALLNRELGNLDGTSVRTTRSADGLSRSTKGVGEETDRTSRRTREYTLEMAKADEISSRRRKSLQAEAKALVDQEQGIQKIGRAYRNSGSDLDKYSGRLGLLTKSIAAVGPSLIPIATSAVPAVAGLTAGLGTAAAAAGVAALAFHGVGDAVDAVQAYKLEPTTQNLQAMHQALDALGPDGASFAKFIAGLEPELRALQNTARGGLLPGVQEGIDAVLPQLPKVQGFVSRLASEMGDLTAKAGKGLTSDDGFERFFHYIDTEGVPILDDFATATGKVASGVAALIADADPLTSMFTTGLLHGADAFQQWAIGLDKTDGFRDFVAYVEQEGPQVADLLKSVASTGIEIAEDFAPIGSVTLPILTAVSNIIGTIASSPLGPVAAAMISISASVSLATAGASKLAAAWDVVALSAGRAATAEEAAAAAGTGGAAAAAGKGTSLAAMVAGSLLVPAATGGAYKSLAQHINPSSGDLGSKSNISSITASLQNGWGLGHVAKLVDPAAWLGFNPAGWGDKKPVQSADAGLTAMVSGGQGARAAAIFGKITAAAKEQGIAVSDVQKRFPAYTAAVKAAASANTTLGSSSDTATTSIRNLIAAQEAEHQTALQNFDATTAFGQAIQALAKQAATGAKGFNQFTAAGAANRSSVSAAIEAYNGQSRAVKNSVSGYSQMTSQLIAFATKMGATKAQIAAFTSAIDKPRKLVVNADGDQAIATIRQLKAEIASLKGKTIQIRQDTILNTIRSNSKPHINVPAAAAGSFVANPGAPTTIPAHL